uniref:Uncharacterized protein n=1 Tax=Lotus japonicus TaxID=34305 RepID=I3SN09_LOTJA|nr:unknown [Lotus japonicus]
MFSIISYSSAQKEKQRYQFTHFVVLFHSFLFIVCHRVDYRIKYNEVIICNKIFAGKGKPRSVGLSLSFRHNFWDIL